MTSKLSKRFMEDWITARQSTNKLLVIARDAERKQQRGRKMTDFRNITHARPKPYQTVILRVMRPMMPLEGQLAGDISGSRYKDYNACMTHDPSVWLDNDAKSKETHEISIPDNSVLYWKYPL